MNSALKGPLPRDIARAAAQWLALIESGAATDADHQRLQQWRDRDPAHETAWQKLQLFRERFSGVPSTLAMATLDRPRPERRAILKQIAGVTVLLPAAWWLSRQMPLDAWRADLQTSTGEHKRIRLFDGSTLQLNTDSAVNVDMSTRQLTLVRGEIALNVSGRAGLSIQVPFGRITLDRGEACVRLDSARCQVSAVSARVQLQPLHGAELLLLEGQQVTLSATGPGAVSAFDPRLPGWRQRVLMAQDQKLGDFLRELSRYRPGILRWEPELETLRVTGSFGLDDTDRILSLLATSLPVEVHMRTRYWVTLAPRKNLG